MELSRRNVFVGVAAAAAGIAVGVTAPVTGPGAAAAIDPRTKRPFGDHGTHKDAVDFLLNSPQVIAPCEEGMFLRAWREGDLDEWPEFYAWLAKRERKAA